MNPVKIARRRIGDIHFVIIYDKWYANTELEWDHIWMDWFGLHTHGSIGPHGTRLEFTSSSAIVFSNETNVTDDNSLREDHLIKLLEIFTLNNHQYYKLCQHNPSVPLCTEVVEKLHKYDREKFCQCKQFIINTNLGKCQLVLLFKPEEIAKELQQALNIAETYHVTFIWI